MKIIEMERRTLDGEPVVYDTLNECAGEYRDWFCVIETKEEELVYELTNNEDNKEAQRIWNYMVNHAGQGMGVSWGDDDMYGYIRPDETEPEVGEEWTDGDNDKWVRVE